VFVVTLAVAMSHVSSAAASQDRRASNHSIANPRTRIVFPAGVRPDASIGERLLGLRDNNAQLPGLPEHLLLVKRITISLAADPVPGLDASSSAVDGLIVLPYDEAITWTTDKLRRVLRHELAHIATGIYMDYARLPIWFEEGFAEWVAGGLTCEGAKRLRSDLAGLSRQQLSSRPVTILGGGRSRLHYDYYSTFFEFVDSRWHVLQSGALMQLVREKGVEEGLEAALGASIASVLTDWAGYVTGPRRPNESPVCSAADGPAKG
jgi:hypothetical protein